MRRISWLMVAVFFCSSGVPVRADWPAVKNRKTLLVLAVVSGTDSLWGFDKEILDGFCGLHRIKMQVVTVNGWDNLVPNLLAEKGDIIAGAFSVTDERRKLIDYTTETFPTRVLVVSRKPRDKVATLQQLCACSKIGVVRNSSLKELLLSSGVNPLNLLELRDGNSIIADLQKGNLDAGVETVEFLLAELKKDPGLQLGMYIGTPGSQAFGVRKEDVELRTVLSEYIANMRRGLGWNRLVVKYFGPEAGAILKKIRE